MTDSRLVSARRECRVVTDSGLLSARRECWVMTDRVGNWTWSVSESMHIDDCQRADLMARLLKLSYPVGVGPTTMDDDR